MLRRLVSRLRGLSEARMSASVASYGADKNKNKNKNKSKLQALATAQGKHKDLPPFPMELDRKLKSSLREYSYEPTEGPDKGKPDPTKVVVKGGSAELTAFIAVLKLRPVSLIKGPSGHQIAVFSRKDYEASDFNLVDRPELVKPVKFEKWISAGGVVLFGTTEEGLRQVLLVAPKGKFGGYSWSFPKGMVDEGESLVKAAKREVYEESGIKASLLPDGYLGKAEGTSSFTHYYMMVRVSGEPGVGTDTESEKVEWVTWAEAFKRVRGSSRDKAILLKAWKYTRNLTRALA